MKSLHLIMNPNAGTRQGRRFLADMIALFNRSGFLVTAWMTEKRGDAVSIVRDHAAGADVVVACGGDGTLNEVITGLVIGGHEVPLGYVPCGSTNDFAAGLGLPVQVMKACECVISGSPRVIDVGLFGLDRYFSYTASFGAFTQVSWATPQNVKNLLGHTAYLLEGIRSLSEIHPIRMNILADGLEYEDDWLFGAVCNSTSLGGVLRLKDSAVDMSDGLFEALLIPFPPDLLTLNRIISSLTAGHYEDPSLLFLRAREFEFRCKVPVKWTLDGEEADGSSALRIRNIPGAVRIFVPA